MNALHGVSGFDRHAGVSHDTLAEALPDGFRAKLSQRRHVPRTHLGKKKHEKKWDKMEQKWETYMFYVELQTYMPWFLVLVKRNKREENGQRGTWGDMLKR